MPNPVREKRTFQDILTDLDEGRVHEQLTEMLEEVTAATIATNLVGELTLKLSVKREGNAAVVVARTSAKVPRAKANPTMFFTTRDGVLTRQHPSQMEMEQVTVAPRRRPGGEE